MKESLIATEAENSAKPDMQNHARPDPTTRHKWKMTEQLGVLTKLFKQSSKYQTGQRQKYRHNDSFR